MSEVLYLLERPSLGQFETVEWIAQYSSVHCEHHLMWSHRRQVTVIFHSRHHGEAMKELLPHRVVDHGIRVARHEELVEETEWNHFSNVVAATLVTLV